MKTLITYTPYWFKINFISLFKVQFLKFIYYFCRPPLLAVKVVTMTTTMTWKNKGETTWIQQEWCLTGLNRTIITHSIHKIRLMVGTQVKGSESRSGVIDTTLCDKVYQWLATGWWFSIGTLLPPPVKLTTTIQLKYCWKWR